MYLRVYGVETTDIHRQFLLHKLHPGTMGGLSPQKQVESQETPLG